MDMNSADLYNAMDYDGKCVTYNRTKTKDRWTVNLMLNHTNQSMRVTELYIKRDFAPINEANFRLMEYVFGI